MVLYAVYSLSSETAHATTQQHCTELLAAKNTELVDKEEKLARLKSDLSSSKSKYNQCHGELADLKKEGESKTGKIQNLQNQLYNNNEVLNDDLKEEKPFFDDRPKHKLAVVVPFRDRFDEILIFGPWMSKFLTEQLGAGNFEIFIVNQADKYRFNRASLINVGYWAAKNASCDYMVMHDVDLLPNNKELSYRYPSKERDIHHLASPEYHPMYHYKKYVGGVLMLRLSDFENMNGMSNKYWGWGREDDEFYVRLGKANGKIVRPTGLTTGYDTFKHIHDKEHRKRDYFRTKEQKSDQWVADSSGGFDTLKYTVKARYNLGVDSHSVTILDTELDCDRKETPWCFVEPEKSKGKGKL